MNKLIKKLYNRSEIRFLFVGAVNTVVGYIIIISLNLFLPYVTAYTCTYIITIIINFFTHKYITFQSHGKVYKELIRFIIVYIIIYLFGLILLYLLISVFGLIDYVAFGINVVLSALLSYFGHRIISFKNKGNN